MKDTVNFIPWIAASVDNLKFRSLHNFSTVVIFLCWWYDSIVFLASSVAWWPVLRFVIHLYKKALAFASTDWKLHYSIHSNIPAATSTSSTATTADTTAVHNN